MYFIISICTLSQSFFTSFLLTARVWFKAALGLPLFLLCNIKWKTIFLRKGEGGWVVVRFYTVFTIQFTFFFSWHTTVHNVFHTSFVRYYTLFTMFLHTSFVRYYTLFTMFLHTIFVRYYTLFTMFLRTIFVRYYTLFTMFITHSFC